MSAPTNSTIRQIRRYSRQFSHVSDEELRRQALSLKYRAMCGDRLTSLIPAAYGLVNEAIRRRLGVTPYDVQLLGGYHMAAGKIAEMKTGEGKTITAAFPVFLHGLSGMGVHVATVNDYLAERDFKSLTPVYEVLGMSIGLIVSGTAAGDRADAYRQDITYGSAKEFGFDFLRDRLKRLRPDTGSGLLVGEQLVQRPLNFVLVDEADSTLIDEARTPLIIGAVDREEEQHKQACFHWAAIHASQFREGRDFTYDRQRKRVQLTVAGQQTLRQLPENQATTRVPIRMLTQYVENAIKVRRDFARDRNYAVVDNKIVIIDEFTGRPATGRQWQAGIHQSVEAREGVPITPATEQAATITIQNYFRRYKLLAGMTGTAWTSRKEFAKVYNKTVQRIPCHRPLQRSALPARVFASSAKKLTAVVSEIVEMRASGRSVLIGTRSVDKSQILSDLLAKIDIPHRVLNASFLAEESEIVARAGQPGSVTVATNMAGRGTDIKLHPDVCAAGGLHVILTELHESQRIDRQLIGRCARQGDPGSYRIFVSLDDEILRSGLGQNAAHRLRAQHKHETQLARSVFSRFRQAQRKVECRHLVDRMILLRQDQDRQEKLLDSGQDPFLDVVQ